jgi:radical SAM superfamily enzyme YgiQ (UPF0313 family)
VSSPGSTNVLLVYPKNPVTFWSFDESLKMFGKKSAFPPLGLLTIAGMCPDDFDMKLVDLNVAPLEDAELEWADVVLTSSMIIHWESLEGVIARCNEMSVPVLNGGPLPTQYYKEIQGDAGFYLGEAENGFVDVVREMAARGTCKREYFDYRGKFQDLELTPVPRWDLIEMSPYRNMVAQMTRGCPESCTFCNIPSLYGKTTRLKKKSRIILELEALYDAGWRGGIMVVDDNFVGNAETIKEALIDEVIPWQKERGHPFQFMTQVSIRVADDEDLLEAMYQAGFDEVFAGIESPVPESLKFMGARKNLQGNLSLLEKVRVLHRYGFEVMAGFIIGLDTDPEDIADLMIDFVQTAGIPVSMVGILSVLPDTPDYKRFQRMGRLVQDNRFAYTNQGVFGRELTFEPLIPPEELFDRHRKIVEAINSPRLYFERCVTFLKNRGRRRVNSVPVGLQEVKGILKLVWRQGVIGDYRGEFWKFMFWVLRTQPDAIAAAISLAVVGQHLILTTREALHVDEMKTFFDEAVEWLESYSQGYRESLKTVSDRAGRLWQMAHARFEHYNDHGKAFRHNAAVLVNSADEFSTAVRVEVRHQIHEPLERFQKDVNRLLETYAPEEEAV